MMIPIRRAVLLGASSALLPYGASIASAQTADSSSVQSPPARSDLAPLGQGDIVVTATRQAQPLSKVPISVSAYSKEALDSRGVRDFTDIVRQTPGLVFETTNTTTNVAIRGINSPVGAATTGVYIDDTPIQVRSLGYGGGNAYPVIFDLERVEVLRGPQGTLFGAGSEGGTIRFITPEPNLSRYEVYARSELAFIQHGDASGEAGVAVGGPLVADKLGFRVSGFYRHDGGYIDRINYLNGGVVEGNSNYSDTYVGRAALTWEPAPNLRITPSIFFQKVYTNDSFDSWDNLGPDQPLSDYSEGKFFNGNPVQEWSKDRFYLPNLKVNYSLGSIDFIAIGSYFNISQQFNSDYTIYDQSLFTGVTLPIFPGQHAQSYFLNTQKNYTAEARLQSSDPDARFRWVVGGFWSRNKQLAIQQVEDRFFPLYTGLYFPPDTFGPLVDDRLIYDQASRAMDEQLAVFGELNFKPIDILTLTIGGRYSKTKFTIAADAQGPVVGPAAIDNGKQKEHPFTPKFGISLQASPETLIYGSVSKGFRTGGYNPQVGSPCGPELASIGYPDGRPPLYNADSVWSYELGAKSRLLGGALGIQASVYQIDWNNIQQVVSLNTCGFAFTSNLGSARSRGFDVQASLRVTDHLNLSAEIGYTNPKFRKTIYGGPTAAFPFVSAGDEIANPPWTVSLHGEYSLSWRDYHDTYFRVDYDYRSHQTALTPLLNPNNGAIDPTLANPPATHYLTTRIGHRIGGVDASFFINNLLDKHEWTRRQRDNLYSDIFYSQIVRPRTFGITVSYRY